MFSCTTIVILLCQEMNSDCEEEEEETEKSPTVKEVTTPPPVENPLSSDSRDRLTCDSRTDSNKDCNSQPNLEASSDDADSCNPSQNSMQTSTSPAAGTDDSDSDVKRNSLKTLANLANLDTPTNLSPCESSSPNAGEVNADPSPNTCPYCSEYIVGSDIKSHVSSKHAFKPAFQCTQCCRVYTRKNALDIHAKECKKES